MKYLISVGLNRINPSYYGTDGQLRGCVNDVYDVRDFVLPDDYIFLLNEEGTVANFTSAVKEYTRLAKEGDTVFINYSGHGTQIRNKVEPDGFSEAFCFYDKILLDRQFNNLIAEFAKGVKVIAFIDACHSGGITRLPNPSDKYKPKSLPLEYNSRDFIKIKPVKAKFIGLLACLERQVAMDGLNNGLFTETMLKNYKQGMSPIEWLQDSTKLVSEQTFSYKTFGEKYQWKKDNNFKDS
jgi:hypothetical protein